MAAPRTIETLVRSHHALTALPILYLVNGPTADETQKNQMVDTWQKMENLQNFITFQFDNIPGAFGRTQGAAAGALPNTWSCAVRMHETYLSILQGENKASDFNMAAALELDQEAAELRTKLHMVGSSIPTILPSI